MKSTFIMKKIYLITSCALILGGVFVFVGQNAFASQAPILNTYTATSIGTNSAILNGNVATYGVDNTQVFFKWGSSPQNLNTITPFQNRGNQSGTFSQAIGGLQPNTSYFFQACASNQAGQSCGGIVQFITTQNPQPPQPQLPTVITETAQSITQTSATLRGTISSTGNSSISSRLFRYGTQPQNLNQTLTVSGSQTGTGTFGQSLSGLQPNTSYFFQACASNQAGQSCGGIVQFITTQNPQPPQPQLPTVITRNVISFTETSGVLQGEVVSLGTSTLSDRYFEWGLSNGNLANRTSASFGTVGVFTQQISQLQSNTEYFYRACVLTTNGDTVCGSVFSFRTQSVVSQPLVVVTDSPQSITSNSALLRGTITSLGSSGVSQRYFEWGFSSGSLNNRLNVSGSQTGTGSFGETVFGLQSNTTYLYRACVHTFDGVTVCGGIQSFTTFGSTQQFLEVETRSATNISEDRATLRGEVINSNGQSIVSRYFEWGTSSGSLFNTLFVSGSQSGNGSFSQTLNGLQDGRRYYYRACAEGSNGTRDCGSIEDFETDDENTFNDEEKPEVETRSATNIDEDRATLRGRIVDDGGDDVFAYFEWGFSSGSLNNRLNASGTYESGESVSRDLFGLQSDTRYYFRLCGENNEGRDCGSVESFTTDDDFFFTNPTNLPQVSTLNPVAFDTSSATLSGFCNAFQNGAQTFFEYGNTPSLGNRTVSQSLLNQSGGMAQFITGLAPNTTYYYRAGCQNSQGVAFGNVVPFTTRGFTQVLPPIIQQPPIVIQQPPTIITRPVEQIVVVENGSGSSFVRLFITNNQETIRPLETVVYEVEWENISSITLERMVLEVRIPENLPIINASLGRLDKVRNTLIIEIRSLEPNAIQSVRIQTQSQSGLQNGDPVVAQAILAFENPINNAQENAIAYDADIYDASGVALTASVFGFSFFPNTLIGWLILLLIILLVIWIARNIIIRSASRDYPPSRPRQQAPYQSYPKK
jgi:hypothetical protein